MIVPSLSRSKQRNLFSALLILSMLSFSQASLLEEEEGVGNAPAQARVKLEMWELKRNEAREAFRPVLEALKALGDEAAYQVVLEREGDNFLSFVQGKAQLGWQNQKIVVAYLKELYDDHTDLIKTHARVQDLLESALSSIEREQGVSADLRRLLQKKIDRLEEVSARRSGDVSVDIESQRPTERSALLPEEPTSRNDTAPLCTRVFYTSIGIIVGAGFTFLGTYLYFKYQH
jgi:hypothetical protein